MPQQQLGPYRVIRRVLTTGLLQKELNELDRNGSTVISVTPIGDEIEPGYHEWVIAYRVLQ